MIARRAAVRLPTVRPGVRAAGTKATENKAKHLSRKEEMKARQDAMAEMLREKAMAEVAQSAAGIRPEGIRHPEQGLDDPVKRLAKLRDAGKQLTQEKEELGEIDESGGPNGAHAATLAAKIPNHLTLYSSHHTAWPCAGREPTRFGDWERNGRAFDF